MLKTITTSNTSKITVDDEKIKIFKNIKEWRAEGERIFGKDIKQWRFKCPMCGHVASVQDFIDAGAGDATNAAYVECIGRYTGKGTPTKGDSTGCNWAAYGLFGIPKGGVVVMTGEDKGQHIFEFADAAESEVAYE